MFDAPSGRMQIASFALRFALPAALLCTVTGCEPAPELLPAEPSLGDLWFDEGSPWTVRSADGQSVPGLGDLGSAMQLAPVEGGFWVCGENGLASYDWSTGAWTSHLWEDNFVTDYVPSCLFDARNLTDAWLYGQKDGPDWGDEEPAVCHIGVNGWDCAESFIWAPISIKVTPTKVFFFSDQADYVAVVSEAGTGFIAFDEYYYGGRFEKVPGADVVLLPGDEHLLQFDATSVTKLDTPAPYGRDGTFEALALGPDHYYLISWYIDQNEECGTSWSNIGCRSTSTNWSEVNVIEMLDGNNTVLGKHREADFLIPTSVLEGGELRVQFGDNWYTVP